MNEMPVTDTSKEVRKVVENHQNDGKWICSVPYGYTMTDSKAIKFTDITLLAKCRKDIIGASQFFCRKS